MASKTLNDHIPEIITALGTIHGLPEGQAAAVAEACDILYDYDAVCADAARMTAKYETQLEAVERTGFGYTCPTCGKWIHVPDSWCHWCGQKLRWSRTAYDNYKLNKKGAGK